MAQPDAPVIHISTTIRRVESVEQCHTSLQHKQAKPLDVGCSPGGVDEHHGGEPAHDAIQHRKQPIIVQLAYGQHTAARNELGIVERPLARGHLRGGDDVVVMWWMMVGDACISVMSALWVILQVRQALQHTDVTIR